VAGVAPRWAAPSWLWPSELSLAQLLAYDFILIAFSGGKDSLWCLLYLLALGVPPSRIELWHHLIDGNEGSDLMDWPCTTAYCEAVARAVGVPLYKSWHIGGFEGEMLKENQRTAGACWENPDGTVGCAGGTHGELGTRRMFPLPVGDLTRRWCSAKGKIEVADMALRNQPRFDWHRTLMMTGERAEESPKRRGYAHFEPHRVDLRRGRVPRTVDHWRPAHERTVRDVWKLIEYFGVNPHPAYWLGFGRVSCATCIFGDPDQWATLLAIMPERVQRIVGYEREFKKTISLRKDKDTGRYLNVLDQAQMGTPYPWLDPDRVRAALSTTFDQPIFLGDAWRMPPGALRKTPGPT
jgi:hypothetical protein